MTERVAHWMTRGMSELRELAPYVATALLLPGGSVLAVLAWLHQHHHKAERQS